MSSRNGNVTIYGDRAACVPVEELPDILYAGFPDSDPLESTRPPRIAVEMVARQGLLDALRGGDDLPQDALDTLGLTVEEGTVTAFLINATSPSLADPDDFTSEVWYATLEILAPQSGDTIDRVYVEQSEDKQPYWDALEAAGYHHHHYTME